MIPPFNESILTDPITVWYAGATIRDRDCSVWLQSPVSTGPVQLKDTGA